MKIVKKTSCNVLNLESGKCESSVDLLLTHYSVTLPKLLKLCNKSHCPLLKIRRLFLVISIVISNSIL